MLAQGLAKASHTRGAAQSSSERHPLARLTQKDSRSNTRVHKHSGTPQHASRDANARHGSGEGTSGGPASGAITAERVQLAKASAASVHARAREANIRTR